jgi:polysaccharide export outer membrane protein
MDVEKVIIEALRAKAVNPQALVNVVKSSENSVTVAGDAVAGGQVQLGPNNERVLEAVAVTGGIRTPVHDTFVSLTRGTQIVTVPYLTLASNPEENIRLSPHDVLFVYAHKRTYTVFGASALRGAEVPFDAPAVTLAQAVARVGGLDDEKADTTGVFVFRFEPADFMPILFPDKPPVATGPRMPIIYRLNLRDPTGFFLAQAFYMREGDMIYVSNAGGAELSKFLRIVGSAVSPAVNGAVGYNAVR